MALYSAVPFFGVAPLAWAVASVSMRFIAQLAIAIRLKDVIAAWPAAKATAAACGIGLQIDRPGRRRT